MLKYCVKNGLKLMSQIIVKILKFIVPTVSGKLFATHFIRR
jgi:hypothetical protein